jgi:hypothetical protein
MFEQQSLGHTTFAAVMRACRCQKQWKSGKAPAPATCAHVIVGKQRAVFTGSVPSGHTWRLERKKYIRSR